MNDRLKESPLRAWYCKVKDVPFILNEMASAEIPSYMAVETVISTGNNNVLIFFRGNHPFLETELKKKYPNIVRGESDE